MHIVILGNGISGITAARWIRKLSGHRVTVISAESDYFFSRTALMYIYMGHMRYEDIKPYEDEFWHKNRINLVRGKVDRIDFAAKSLHFDLNFRPENTRHVGAPEALAYDKLILALGSASNKFGWPGEDLKHVHGLYHLQDLADMEAASADLKRAVIVGGGLIGIEMAEMFHARSIPTTMLVRESSFWQIVLPLEEAKMIDRHIVKHGIDLRLSTELKSIEGNEEGEVVGVRTLDGACIPCQFVGLTVGVHPNVHWLKGTALEIDRGILVDDYLSTNIPDVYAVGDCAQLRSTKPNRRSIEAIWYTGRMMGEVVAHVACDRMVAYDPGIWFNSAKFFDIEYQVYGQVPNEPSDKFDHLYWEHDSGEKSIRLVFDRYSAQIKGFNLMGVRFRQEVCQQWIVQQTPLKSVVENLPLASFDPEFAPTYHRALAQAYADKFGGSLQASSRWSLDRVINFLNAK